MNYEQLIDLYNKRRNHDVKTFENLLHLTDRMMAMINATIDMAKEQKRFCDEFYPVNPPIKNKVCKIKKTDVTF